MRIVVKVGTSTLAHATGRMNIRHVEDLVKVLSDLKNAGHEVILVSSGAIAMGVGKLNLPDANMLNKLSPFFAILFSIFLLREKPNLVQVLGVLVAFGGSVCIIKPSFANPQMLPALAGVLGGLGAGAAYTFVRYLGARGENGSRIVFYFSAFSCIVCVPFVALDYAPMSLLQLVYLLLAGAFACVGQLGITKAYVCAPAREISVYDYTQVLFAAALGFFVFGDVPDWLSVLGYVLICGAGVGMFLYNRRHDAAHP